MSVCLGRGGWKGSAPVLSPLCTRWGHGRCPQAGDISIARGRVSVVLVPAWLGRAPAGESGHRNQHPGDTSCEQTPGRGQQRPSSECETELFIRASTTR